MPFLPADFGARGGGLTAMVSDVAHMLGGDTVVTVIAIHHKRHHRDGVVTAVGVATGVVTVTR